MRTKQILVFLTIFLLISTSVFATASTNTIDSYTNTILDSTNTISDSTNTIDDSTTKPTVDDGTTNKNAKNLKFEIVEDNICTININKNAILEKKMTNYDLEKKEVTIGLQVSNNAVRPLDKPSEVVLLIDNSYSMIDNTISTGDTRMYAVLKSSKMLASELLKLDTVKLSVVSFSSINSHGINKTLNPELFKEEGTINDAKLITPLTNSKEAIMSGIESIDAGDKGDRTDIDAGLTLASQQFSGTCESQYIILLTDGVPNLCLGVSEANYNTADINNTKSTLINLNSQGIGIIAMMTGLTDINVPLYDGINVNPNDETRVTKTTHKEIAQAIFGTPNNPTVGKYHNVTDDQIEETISKKILAQLIAPEDDILTDIDINDYFPQYIVDNFEFEYVSQPSKGNASASIDLQNNIIAWHIDSLSYGESATLTYKLILKEKFKSEILDKTLSTNEKLDITTANVVDENGNKKIMESTESPKVKLSLVIIPTPTPTPDTRAPEPIPQTGSTSLFTIIIIISMLACAYATFKYIKYSK